MTTNEQIMIDGVDVSGCADFITEMTVPDSYAFVKLKNRCFQECKYDQTAEQDVYLPCRDNPNCYYKQLQRKEKECEEVSNEIEELNVKYETVVNLAKKNADSNEYCLQELEKENAELKQDLKYALETYQFKDNFLKVIDAERIKYKQALEEIEKIVTLDKTHIKYAGSTLVICDDILDIIRKAKGEEG